MHKAAGRRDVCLVWFVFKASPLECDGNLQLKSPTCAPHTPTTWTSRLDIDTF